MPQQPPAPTPDDCEELARQPAARLLEVRRESRRRLWSRLGYLLMLLGALGGLITALAVILDLGGRGKPRACPLGSGREIRDPSGT